MLVVNLAILVFVFISITTTIFVTARLLSILQPLRGPSRPRKRGQHATHLMIVLGSGGHTAEMLAMLQSMDTLSYSHRSYIVSDGDSISGTKAIKFEEGLSQRSRNTVLQKDQSGTSSSTKDEVIRKEYGSYSISFVPRARKIHQSLLTTPYSCLKTFVATLRLLQYPPKLSSQKANGIPKAPDLILTNGPATSAIVIFSSIILRFLDITGENHGRTRIVFVESLARIHSLSLSAKCVAFVVDRLIVQWENLKGSAWGRAEYGGPIVVSSLEQG